MSLLKSTCVILLALFTMASCQLESTLKETSSSASKEMAQTKSDYAIVIHGGAGVITKAKMSDEKETAVTAALNAALNIGEAILKNGGNSMDAVEKTIEYLENSEHFNAGKGAVFTNAGTNELDASFMDGSSQNAGAVGGVTNIKNPIKAARIVMEKSKHVLLSGKGAEAFAISQGIETVNPSYFHTQHRWESLEKAKSNELKQTGFNYSDYMNSKYGTVGCVALDKAGNIAAGTSTGGMTNKKFNRIGDSPIIGAGCYADNSTCGVSCTGWGEFFIRYAVAYDVHARMAYGNADVATAANAIINEKLVEKGGTGGLIALDKYGNISMPFNTKGMYRGYAKPNERVIKIYEE